MRSMTGFGAGAQRLGSAQVAVESRAVNHRYLDVRVRMPREMVEHGVYVEQLVRARLSRGRLDVSVHCDGCGTGTLTLNRPRALSVLRSLQSLAEEVGIREPVPLSVLANVPDLFISTSEHDVEAVRESLKGAVAKSLDALDRMREDEGAHLAADIGRRLDVVMVFLARVTTGSEHMVERHRARLRERLEKLLEGFAGRLDPTRFEQEIAILADHVDIAEELTRLDCHAGQFRKLLGEGEPVGRRMDFLLQEMAREANTIASKATDAEVSLATVDLKAEIERMREQVQNVE